MCRELFLLVLIFSVFLPIFCQNLSARHFNKDCGQVFTQKQFVIESLRYPSNYPSGYECSYLVKGPPCPTYFTLEFIDFNVENSLGCSKDRLEVEDQDVLCGNRNDIKQYFSSKGTLILRFVSDSERTGRGYRILITRMPCGMTASETTTTYVPKWHTTNNDVEYTTTVKPSVFSRGLSKCCQVSYGSKQFILTSPNFPYSMSTPTECVFEIYKRNHNVCRLRIRAQFFWLGRYSTNCPEGFLEIDGKFICGCKTDLKLITLFEGSSSKILRFVSKGYERSSYSGFVLEITQDECPKKYLPEEPKKNQTFEEDIRFYNDQIHRVSSRLNDTHKAMLEKLHLINENTEVIEDDSRQSKVVRHVYFFADSDFNKASREREEVDYVDTSAVRTTIIQDPYGYNYCLQWNRQEFSALSMRRLPVCKTNEGSVVEKQCVEMSNVRGYFRSPGYPFYYQGNLNVCYRFKKQPGYCSVRLYMQDFHLESSPNCSKDYLLFSNQIRYCGSQISNTISTLDLRNQPYEDVYFVTDAFYCGKGFFGTFEQIACQTTPTTTTPPPMVPCGMEVQDAVFTLDVYDYNKEVCVFTIRKNLPYVCAVRLYFEKFDLACATESLLVDGTMYCGHLSGQSVQVDLTNRGVVLTYRKSSNVGIDGLRFKINGVQILDGCPGQEVPVERLLSGKSFNFTKAEDGNRILLKIEKQFKEICGVITNTTEAQLPETFCDFLMKHNNNVTKCLPLSENSLIIPLDNQKLELKIRTTFKTEEIEFEEVDCDKLSTLQ